MKLLPRFGYLFWTQDIDGTRTAYNTTPFQLKFEYIDGTAMKTSRQFLLWLVVVVMFCAAVSVGCGGSSNNDSTDPTDDSGGRNQNGWEDLTFEEFAGAWEFSSITMGLNGVELFPEGLAITRFRFNATAGDFGGNLAITRLDGTDIPYLTSSFNDSQGINRANNVVILSSGVYSSTSLGNVFRQYPNEADRNSYIQLLGSSSSNGYDDSLP